MFGYNKRRGHRPDHHFAAGPFGGFGGPGRFGRDEEDGFGGRGGGRGRRKVIDNAQLRLLLLCLLAEKPSHGYELIRAIEEQTGGAYAPSPGVIYPTLTLLAETGLASEQAAEGARKLYAITAEGRAELAEKAKEVEQIVARLKAMGELRGRVDPAPVRRAVMNLRSVLMNRLAEGLDKDRLHDAVALIDEVAGRIERL